MDHHPFGTPGKTTAQGRGLWMIDLGFQEREGVIAAYLIDAGDALALIETGPSSTLPRLLAGIRAAGFDPADVTDIDLVLAGGPLPTGGVAAALRDAGADPR